MRPLRGGVWWSVERVAVAWRFKGIFWQDVIVDVLGTTLWSPFKLLSVGVVLRGIFTGFIVTLDDDMSSFAVSAMGAMMEFITELVAVILGGDDEVSGVDCKKIKCD